MSKILKYSAFAIMMQATLMTGPVVAGPVQSNTEFFMLISVFVQKMEKIKAYVDEIKGTKDLIESYGDLGKNAAKDMLRKGINFLADYQDSIHFGDIASSVASGAKSISGSLDAVSGAVDMAKGISDSAQRAINVGRDLSSDPKAVAGQVASGATDALKASLNETLSDMGISGDSLSVKSRGKTSDIMGVPQGSLEAAQAYVKDKFFYSTREGDKPTGKALETSMKGRETRKNREAYYQEVISSVYGQAMEANSKGFNESKKRAEDLMAKAKAAETYDDKKAVEVAIMQNDIRERMMRLSLELGALELEAAQLLMKEPREYIVARSAAEIEAEAKAKLKTGGK